ncbi:hypothetical protein, partial [Ruegeria faecimaris]|uniref:hypothetical protein n=1 Tax=Ruegeria faecimaris TaxID=686389 RepID=UPI002493408E
MCNEIPTDSPFFAGTESHPIQTQPLRRRRRRRKEDEEVIETNADDQSSNASEAEDRPEKGGERKAAPSEAATDIEKDVALLARQISKWVVRYK